MIDESKGLHIDMIYNMLTCGVIDKFGSCPDGHGGFGYYYYYCLYEDNSIIECDIDGNHIGTRTYNNLKESFGEALEWYPILNT